MDIKKVLLLGGSGFVGTYIVNRLSQRGIEVTVPTRRRERTKALIIQPGVSMPEANIHCEKTLTELMRGHDAVINLVGILHSRDVVLPYSRDFAEAHVELPKKIVAACKAVGRSPPGAHERAQGVGRRAVRLPALQGRRRSRRARRRG